MELCCALRVLPGPGNVNKVDTLCYTIMQMSKAVAEARTRIEEGIAESARRVGRDAGEVRIMAVTKNHPLEAVQECLDAGISLFGENRVQEAQEKYAESFLRGVEAPELHLIGHLQRNKAKLVPDLFSAVQSIDAERTARALSQACAARNLRMQVYLEVNTSGEESKQGVRDEDALLRLVEGVAQFPELEICGLMTIAPFTREESVLRESFRRLRVLRDRAAARFPEQPIRELSMGMTNDYRIAVEEGSTMLRIGTGLLGARTYGMG